MDNLYYMEEYKPHLVVQIDKEIHVLPIGMLEEIANKRHDVDRDTMAAIATALLSYAYVD